MQHTGPDGSRAFGVHLFGHTTVHTPDRILRASDFMGVRKTAIAEQIWAGRPPRRWQVTLESYVALLRRAMQPGVPGRTARTVIELAVAELAQAVAVVWPSSTGGDVVEWAAGERSGSVRSGRPS